MKSVIINLVSDQTIPNILLIKQYLKLDPDYCFITTKSMERRCRRTSIIETSSIDSDDNDVILVDEYDINDIVSKLSAKSWSQYDRIIINLTGGTKIMSLATYRFFSAFPKAEMYYVVTEGNHLSSLNVLTGTTEVINSDLSPQDYLLAYGFKGKAGARINDPVLNKRMFDLTLSGFFESHVEILSSLRSRRNKGVNKDYTDYEHFLCEIGFSPKSPGKLSSSEVQYITGEWFEEYIADRISSTLDINRNDIISGFTISEPTRNELDVAFMYSGKFHVIECKTSIINQIIDPKKGIKSQNILGETLYKADSLKNKFGLFAKYYICTLTCFQDYKNKGNNEVQQMEELMNRADLSRVKLIDRDTLLDNEHFKNAICS